MSYKKQREANSNFDYDFIDVGGPCTYKEIDTLFHEYCKDFSTKDKAPVNPVKSQNMAMAGSRSSLLRPSTAKLSDTSTLSNNKKAWDVMTGSRIYERVYPQTATHKSIEFEEDVIAKMYHVACKNNAASLNSLDDEINQLAQEFGINLGILSSIQNPEKKHEYVIECMRKKVKDDLKDFTKKHNARLNNILNFETEFQKLKEKQYRDGADIFGWLHVNTPHEPLKKKLRSRLAETIQDHENQSKIEVSLDELRKTKDSGTASTFSSKKIQLDNVPHVDNFEIMQGILAGHSDNLLKMTKSMKHASRKNVEQDTKKPASVEPPTTNRKSPDPAKQANKEAEEEKTKWDWQKEKVFKYYREDAKSRLFDEINSSNWNQLGFSPHVQVSQKIEKSKQQRDTKLANYMNGDLLTPEDYKLLANTSITLNKFVDKKYLQTVVNHLDPEIISAIETDLAEHTLKDYSKRQKEVKEARLKYLKKCNDALVKHIEIKEARGQRHAKVLAGKDEQKKIKQRAISLLNRVAERKTWNRGSKAPEPQPVNTNNDTTVDIGHFAHKFLKVVNKSVQARKFKRSQEFLKRLLPFRQEEPLFDIQESKHFFHPSSKLIVSTENHAKDYLGLGTENLDPELAARRNDSVKDYKLTIHSPPKFKVNHNFKRFYSGGPINEEDRIFQGNNKGDLSKYKVDKFLIQIVLKIQSAYRGYRERKMFKMIQERVQERNRTVNRLEFLKDNTSSNFLKTVLQATDRFKSKKNKNKSGEEEMFGLRSSQLANSNTKRPESHRITYDAKMLTSNEVEKARHTNMYESPSQKATDFGHNEYRGSHNIKSIPSVELSKNDIHEGIEIRKPIRVLQSRPKTAMISSKSPASALIYGGKGKLELSKQGSEMWPTFNSDHEGSPDEARLQKIVGRAPPKGLLLKQRKLFTAAKTSNYSVILNSGFNYYESDVNSKDDEGNTPLFYAAQNGNKDICEFLVNHKARVNEPCKDGNTPLHMAFYSDQEMLVILLISHGGNLNILNDFGQTPVAFGSKRLLTLLDLTEAVATYEKQTNSKKLPAEFDNNRFMTRYHNKNDSEGGCLSFNYAPLQEARGKVDSELKTK